MSGLQSRRPGELAFVCIMTGFSAVALWQAYLISGFKGLSTPGIFPMLAAGTMLLSAVFILRATLRAKPANMSDADQEFMRDIMPMRLVIVLVLVAVYLTAMPWLGFIVSSELFLFASIAILWGRGVWFSLLLSTASLAFIYFLFRIVFQVVLPNGSLIPRGIF